jgi:hypothetical protein
MFEFILWTISEATGIFNLLSKADKTWDLSVATMMTSSDADGMLFADEESN